jgi:AAHS family cis,cis-muconate transporter-like MFS transporter
VITSESLGRTRMVVAIAVFVALVVDGMDLQMLALALPSISSDMQLSGVAAGALGTFTLLGMGVGGYPAGPRTAWGGCVSSGGPCSCSPCSRR